MADIKDILRILLLPLWLLESFFKACIDLFVPAAFRTQKDVTGEIVLVTGGGAGLGRSIAIELAKLGAIVVTWDINQAGNEETLRMIRKLDGVAHAYTVDISKADDVYAAADKVRREVGDVMILVNNAAIGQTKPVWQLPDQILQRMMDVNAVSHFWLLKAFLPAMKASNHGHIATILSGSVNLVPMGLGAYIASKSAALGLQQALQRDLIFERKTGVKITVAFPNFIATDMTVGHLNSGLAQVHPPQEIAKTVIQGIRMNTPIVTTAKLYYFFYLMKNFIPTKFFLWLFRIGQTETVFINNGVTAAEDSDD